MVGEWGFWGWDGILGMGWDEENELVEMVRGMVRYGTLLVGKKGEKRGGWIRSATQVIELQDE